MWGPQEGLSSEWEGLSAAEQRAWQAAAHARRYRDGDVLLREGEPARCVLLVQAGLVKVQAVSHDGQVVLLAIRGPGEILGEISALDGGGHSATVAALGEVRAASLSRGAFLDFLQDFPRVSVALLVRMSQRLRESDGQRLEYGTRASIERLASRLLDLAERYGDTGDRGIRLTVHLTQGELAESIAASRESVVKALRRLRASDAVELDADGHLVLRDLSLLRDIAAGVTHDT